MRVFITGSTGYLGSAVVKALVAAGHAVTGLVRSADKEAALKLLGGVALRGDLKEPTSYGNAAAEHDAIVHIGFEGGPNAASVDLTAVQTLTAAARTNRAKKSFVYTSGVWVLGDTAGKQVFEDGSVAAPAKIVAWRVGHEKMLTEATTGDLSVSVIRPGLVYGGKTGILSDLFQTAAKDGVVTYVGAGANHWPLVHRDDLAQLYRLAIEKRAWGILHGVDGRPMKVVDVATAASQAAGKGGKTKSMSVEEARKTMGPYADMLCMDQQIYARRSVELGWKPSRASFAEGAAAAFAEWKA
jgi:nucleoside-diphosphate-sugar epimerase